MVLSDEGINDYNLKTGAIPWSEVTQAYVSSMLWYKNVGLHVRNLELLRQRQPRYLRALSAYNAAFSTAHFVLQMNGTDTKAEAVIDYINQQLLRQWPAPAPVVAAPVRPEAEGEY